MENTKRLDSTGLNISYHHKYDEQGNVVESKAVDCDGKLVAKYSYSYDEQGNLVAWGWKEVNNNNLYYSIGLAFLLLSIFVYAYIVRSRKRWLP